MTMEIHRTHLAQIADWHDTVAALHSRIAPRFVRTEVRARVGRRPDRELPDWRLPDLCRATWTCFPGPCALPAEAVDESVAMMLCRPSAFSTSVAGQREPSGSLWQTIP